jgi:hypothetical protein
MGYVHIQGVPEADEIGFLFFEPEIRGVLEQVPNVQLVGVQEIHHGIVKTGKVKKVQSVSTGEGGGGGLLCRHLTARLLNTISKSQIPNPNTTKQIPNPNDPMFSFGIWKLGFTWDLVFIGHWDLLQVTYPYTSNPPPSITITSPVM